jgi:hypothetical protein
MALEVVTEIANVHEDSVCSIAYDRAKRTVYTVAEGDKAIKVRAFMRCCMFAQTYCRCHAGFMRSVSATAALLPQRLSANPDAPLPPPTRAAMLQVWDLKAGALLRTQTVHRGMVTSVVYAPGARLLFSAAIDGAIGVWTDKGALLQVRRSGCTFLAAGRHAHTTLDRVKCPSGAPMLQI